MWPTGWTAFINLQNGPVNIKDMDLKLWKYENVIKQLIILYAEQMMFKEFDFNKITLRAL